MVNKNTLRLVYLEKRLFLSKEEYQSRNTALQNRLFEYIDFNQFQFLHSFLSIADKNEVDTWQIIKRAEALHQNLKVAVSKTVANCQLEHYLFNADTTIKVNNWGIPEPVKGELADITSIDLVLVPLLVFDKNGHRIGYGKGYYDRFLKKVPQAKKVGVSLLPPLDDIIYTDEMDVKLDACVTPFGVYEF